MDSKNNIRCSLCIDGTEFVYVFSPQQIWESGDRMNSSLRNRLSEQAAERVSCPLVVSSSLTDERGIGLAIE